ncbi:MotE family protein [Pseudoroseomonas sp. WGS1072]|uniref:MotE family protein n=1 Tax=Roseomonas sp. WGS1072 TaxID=3366816 RepID=UPI003BF0D209
MTPPLPIPPRRRAPRLSRMGLSRMGLPRMGLPLMLLGLAALVPGRLEGLSHWSGLAGLGFAGAWAQGPERPRPGPGAPPPVMAPVMTMGGGLTARPTVAPVLAGPIRANPLGDDRPGDARLLAEVSRRQAEIERRERALEAREARLQAAEALARGQIAELARLREEMERLVVRENTASEADLDALVALYVNMKPQQAAKVLDRLEPQRAAVILLKIPERQAGPILASMDAPAALAVTQEIAGRREAFRAAP